MSPYKTVIAIDGPAASGKSSTSAMVAEALGFRHADSGVLYRTETARRLGLSDIRSPEVTAEVSRIAHLPEVRAKVDAELHRLAQLEDIVVDGRDIGAVVFPNAQLKVFLIADPNERAKRRLLQRLGHPPTPDEIHTESALLVARDARDAAHTIQAPDAVLLDTTHLTQAEQVRQIVAMVRRS
ncbi:MAG TPA: (d)CMP kinase [Gemmatimonadaceae bacterium]|nr:(d)CMP kinase [Gemmatimonadaceae bacterium]